MINLFMPTYYIPLPKNSREKYSIYLLTNFIFFSLGTEYYLDYLYGRIFEGFNSMLHESKNVHDLDTSIIDWFCKVESYE